MSSTGTIKHAGKDEDIPTLPVENYASEISVEDKGGKAEVEWVATYYRAYVNNNPPAELNEEAADAAVKLVLTSGLEALSKKLAPNDTPEVKIEIKR
jgi:polyketide cyclase/dehydrase/lipid transport protein